MIAADFKELFGDTLWAGSKQEIMVKASVDPKEVARVALALDEAADKLLSLLGLQDDDADDQAAAPAAPADENAPPPPPKKGVAAQAGKVAKAAAAAAFYLDNQE